jgi:D-glycero-alpha-D-manno-heptose 1-phosphate guanylyltransferase
VNTAPPVLVLAGGLGTRLRPLTESVPKVLVPTLGRPFIDHLLEDLAHQGATRFVISVGYLADQIEAHLGDGADRGYQVEYVREPRPLGTGGAIVRALPRLGETFVVVNGDTFLELDLAALAAQHRQGEAPVTMAAARVPDRGRYGALGLERGRVVAFEEKRPGAGPGWINGGVMAMDGGLFDGAPDGPFSLERDWLPRFLGRIAVFKTEGFFVDMGTHETLQTLDGEMERYLARVKG